MTSEEEPNLLSPEAGTIASTAVDALPSPTILFPSEMELAEPFIRIIKHNKLPLTDKVPDSSKTPVAELFKSFGIEMWPDLAFFSHEHVQDYFKSFPSKEITLRDNGVSL